MRLTGTCLAIALVTASAFAQETTGSRAMGFSAVSVTGNRVFVNEMLKDGPVFVYFIRPGDGVNSKFAQQISRILSKYPNRKLRWYGVINGDQQRAKSWAAEFNPKFDLLLDNNLEWVQRYAIQSSPALMLLGTDGKPIKTWSGFSGYWLKDINKTLAEREELPVTYIDFSNTPSKTEYGTRYVISKNNG